jgi:hypothetical protein
MLEMPGDTKQKMYCSLVRISPAKKLQKFRPKRVGKKIQRSFRKQGFPNIDENCIDVVDEANKVNYMLAHWLFILLMLADI